MTAREAAAARVAGVARLVQVTVRVLGGVAALGVVGLATAVGWSGDWSGDALAAAAVIGAVTALAPLVLLRFGAALAPIRGLPQVDPEELKAAAGSLGAGLKSGQRRFVEARGLSRVVSLGRALWDLRADVQALNERGLAPATALAEVLVPTRLFRVGVAAVAAPVLLAAGALALGAALVLA